MFKQGAQKINMIVRVTIHQAFIWTKKCQGNITKQKNSLDVLKQLDG